MKEKIKVKDIVGNVELKYRFQVMEITFEFEGYQEFIVQDIATFEYFNTNSDKMNLPKN